MNPGKDETFLSRWSRRKAEVRQETVAPPPPPAAPPAPAAAAAPAGPAVPAPDATTARDASRDDAAAPGPATAERAAAAPPPPTLDEVRALTPASDFSRFVAPGVDAEVKNAAMKKLFADPHFNVMDGLDTYIDDYGRADPIPKAMLRQMVQARMLGLLDDELEEQPQPAEAVDRDAAASPQAVAGPVPATAPEAAAEAGPDDGALPLTANEAAATSAETSPAPATPATPPPAS